VDINGVTSSSGGVFIIEGRRSNGGWVSTTVGLTNVAQGTVESCY